MSELHSQFNQLSISGELDPQLFETEFRFADGRIVRIPTALLQQKIALENTQEPRAAADEILIPIIEEQLEVGKRIVETGRVHLHKSVESYDVELDEPLAIEEWRVERVAKHEVVGDVPSTRQEGDTTIYPVVEERLVLTKELVLIEEIRVTRAVSARRDTQTVILRREKMNVEREDLIAPEAGR